MKRITAILLAVLVFGLTACTPQKDGGGVTTTTTVEQSTTTTTAGSDETTTTATVGTTMKPVVGATTTEAVTTTARLVETTESTTATEKTTTTTTIRMHIVGKPTQSPEKIENGYTYYTLDGKAAIIEVSKSIGGAIILPSTLGGCPVTSIEPLAVAFCDQLTSVTIPATVSVLGEEAFKGCANLETVIIQNGVSRIGDRAFESCRKLKKVDMGNATMIVGESAFSQCVALTEITFPKLIKWIYKNAFNGCNKLSDVYYQGTAENRRSINIESVGNQQLLTVAKWHYEHGVTRPQKGTGRSGVFKYTFENGIATITEIAECEIEHLVIPSVVDGYPVKTVRGAIGKHHVVTNVTISEGIETAVVLDRSPSVKTISFPASATKIQTDFEFCSALTAINVADGNPRYCSQDGVLFEKGPMRLVRYPEGKTDVEYHIPDGVTDLFPNAFLHCPYIQYLTLPEGFRWLDTTSFNDCPSLERFGLPRSMEEICFYAQPSFRNVITDVYYRGSEQDKENIFLQIRNWIEFLMPRGITT